MLIRYLLVLVGYVCLVINLSGQNFSNVASALGVDEGYSYGNHGGGVSFCDFNNDGWDDLTFCSGDGLPVYFYLNVGGSFLQVDLVDNDLETKEAIWVDYDNDGDRDLYLTVHNGSNRLYNNNGAMFFTDVTMSAFGALDNLQSFGAAWGDYNRDGWLDLYVCHYIVFGSQTNDLFLNNADGTFTKVSSSTVANNGPTLTFDAIFVDYDHDGWQDLYVINDKYTTPNALYRNLGGTFYSVPAAGADIVLDAMNAGGGDYDDDGDFDFYVTNSPQGNQLLQNDGNGNFSDVAGATGTVAGRTTWGANFFDYDNDQDQDLYVSAVDPQFLQPNPMYVNGGNGTFSEPLEFSGGLGGVDDENSFGNAIGDFNNDGRLDIAVSQMTPHEFLLWQNNETNTNSWLKVKLSGTTSNLEGIGTRVEVDLGNHTMIRYRHGSSGYLSQNSDKLHFGLGSATIIDEMRVYWPSGNVDTYQNINTLNQVLFLTEGETALPLRLVEFSAEPSGGVVNLDWASETERNVSHFLIERSADGREFLPINRVTAVGDSDLGEEYAYTDRDINSSIYYYRLKIVDRDDTFSYSPVRVVNFGQSNQGLFQIISGPPNPVAASEIAFALEVFSTETPLEISLYELSGRLISRKVQQLNSGRNEVLLAVDQLPTATYIVHLKVANQNEVIRLVID